MCGGGSQQVEETQDQKVQADIDNKLWDYYQKNYQPLVSKYAERVTDAGQQDLQSKQVAGKINAAAMKNANPANVSANPVANAKNLSDLARTEATQMQVGQEKVQAKQIGDVQNVINIGRGDATTATDALGRLATDSVKTAISDKELQQQEDAATENAAGSLVGAAAAGYAKSYNKKTLSNDSLFGFG